MSLSTLHKIIRLAESYQAWAKNQSGSKSAHYRYAKERVRLAYCDLEKYYHAERIAS